MIRFIEVTLNNVSFVHVKVQRTPIISISSGTSHMHRTHLRFTISAVFSTKEIARPERENGSENVALHHQVNYLNYLHIVARSCPTLVDQEFYRFHC